MSSIAVIGDVVRKYFPINLILLLGLINIAAMEIKISYKGGTNHGRLYYGTGRGDNQQQVYPVQRKR